MKQNYYRGKLMSNYHPIPLLNIFLLIFLFSLVSLTVSYGQTYNVSGGLAVVEIESQSLKSGWKKGTSGSVTYYEGTSDNFSTPLSGGVLNFSIKFDQPGTYRVNWRSKINIGDRNSDFNDSWLKFPNTSSIVFFAYKGSVSSESALNSKLSSKSNVVFPKGSGLSPNPAGTSANGFFKIYMNNLNGWVWLARTSDFDPHRIYVKVNKAGTYTMQVSNRSKGHAIDKIAIWKIDTHGDNGPSSLINGSGGGGTSCSASLAPLSTLDENDAPITLTGGSPSGGSYSGPSVSNGKFDPSIGKGTYTIKYTVTANGCTASGSRSITVTGSGGGSSGGGGGSGGGGSSGSTTLILVNTTTQQDIGNINDNDIIDLAQVGKNIGIRAEFGRQVTGVLFTLTGPFNWSKSEGSSSPWSLFGDIGVNINPWPIANLKNGNYTLSVKANGTTTTIDFSITEGSGGGSSGGSGGTGGSGGGTGGSISIVLVNTNTQQDISTLNNNAVIDLSSVGKKIGIRADIPNNTTGVSFVLTGPFNWTKSEGKTAPWSLFGDIGVKINPWPSADLKTGNYKLTVKGNGSTVTIAFSITDGGGGSTGGGGTGGTGGGISIVLVNTNTQQDISTLNNNAVIDLSSVGKKIGIRADIPNNTTGVSFVLTGPFNWTKSEGKTAPWSLFGDIGVKINPWPSADLKTGSYKLTVKGNGSSVTIAFSITDGGGGSTGGGGGSGITAVLVNTNTQTDISNINNGDIIDLSKVGSKIGIQAEIPGNTTGVRFTLTGPFNWTKSEGKTAPWSLFGDIGVNINPWPSANLKTGNYTLTIKGNGLLLTVSFQIISGTTANARDISPDFAQPTFSLPQITSVYPNPVTDNRLNVAFSKPIDGEVLYTIYDPTGKAVQLEELDTNNTVLLELRLTEAVSPGMYYLKIKSRTHQVVWHQRFIKTH